MSNYTIPSDPIELFRNRMLFIMGVGRSGTTILGQLIESMEPVYYLNEPVLLRLGLGPGKTNHAMLRSVLFEDYFLPLIKQKTGIDRRKDVIEYLKKEKPLFVIKDPELMVIAKELQEAFPECYFIHIVRNKEDVIVSSLKRGWYTDEFMGNQLSFWCKDGAPWYIDKFEKTTHGRCEQVYDELLSVGILFCGVKLKLHYPWDSIQYEEFKHKPELITQHWIDKFNIQPTDKTTNLIQQIKEYEK